MYRSICLSVCVGLIFSLLASPTPAQVKESQAKSKKKARAPHPALVAPQEDPELPRVLLIGDSISMGYTVPVRERLRGTANVVHPPVNCGPTSRGVESLQSWLGDKKWDVIHFNFGLHDMVYYGSDGQARVEPTTAGARHQVPLEQYEKNLEEIVRHLKKTGATLIWCSTTPVPAGSAGRVSDDSVRFNQVAAKVMKEHDIPTHDLHAFALPRLKEIQLPQNVHFSPEGSRVLAEQVAEAIREALQQRAARGNAS
jgi:hypothetical protein